MCGIVAVISKSYNGFSHKDKDVFDQLLYIDALRGEDSTGVMAVDSDGNLDLAKEASVAEWYRNTKAYQDLLTGAVREGAALIGHNRKATKGTINDENAHPFVVDDRIVLVHNGTLYGDHKKIADTEVDSHAIAHLIHEKGDDVEAALRELHGAYALIWYDVTKKTVNFVRNSQRPLAFVETHTGWVWASEPGMLAWILQRNQIQPAHDAKITMLPEGELHSFVRVGKNWKREVRKLDLSIKPVNSPYDWTGQDANDACAWAGDSVMRRTTTHWEDAEDDVPFTKKNVLTLPPPPTRTAQAASPSMMSVKVTNAEYELGRKGGFIADVARFQEVAGRYNLNGWISGTIVDYDYVRGSTALHGLFVYARMWDHPDILIRCYSPFDARRYGTIDLFELDVVKLVTEEAKHAFKISYKCWHKYPMTGNSKNEGDGMGVIYCTEHAPITINEVNTEAANA